MNLSYRLGWIFFRALYAVYFRWRVFNANRVPATGGVILASNHASFIDPPLVGAAGLKAILDRLLGGGGIILFPEGTRTTDGRLQPARSGVGLTVVKSTAPVVPVRVFGSYEAYGRRMTLPRPRRVVVKFGAPLDFAALRAEAKTCDKARLKQIYQQVADEIMAAIARLEPQAD